MLHKVYDITGYLCGHRIFNLFHLNRLRSDYKDTFQNYYVNSRHANGATALLHDLPAQYILFREHSEGLYYAKKDNFTLIKIIQAIWMQSLSTDVLISFNAFDPVKLVHKIILNSKSVQSAFRTSCYMLQDHFKEGVDLAVDENPTSFLYQFIIIGFTRTHAKDIYQLRLSNALLSKTGASGIRTNLLSFSAKAISSKASLDNDTVKEVRKLNNTNEHKKARISANLNCSCGRSFSRVSWYNEHILNCSSHTSTSSDKISADQTTHQVSELLNTLIELEGMEELVEFHDEDFVDKLRTAEKNMEYEENQFDAAFSSHLIIDDIEF